MQSSFEITCYNLCVIEPNWFPISFDGERKYLQIWCIRHLICPHNHKNVFLNMTVTIVKLLVDFMCALCSVRKLQDEFSNGIHELALN